MNAIYIAMATRPSEYGGWWGVGEVAEEAIRQCRNSGAKRKSDRFKLWRFDSRLPFAPRDRDALDTEADAWVGQDGGVRWIRCDRVELDAGEYGVQPV